ncbi:MAG: carbohydrate ABC transporter permease [Fimbriimonadales bacterium]|nr:carbohydrate ABC transporter permease [Fimbriimonadales bacterium]
MSAVQDALAKGFDVEAAERFRRAAKRAEAVDRALKVLLWVVLFGGVILAMLPLWIMLMMSLKTPNEIANSAAWAWPREITWANFREVLTNPNAPFILFFRNSLIISTLTTIGVVLTSAMVAYPFARMKFRGRDRLFILLLSTMMLPGVVTMIPTYVMYAHLKWVNTFYPLIVPAWFGGGAFNIFLLRQFFMGIPRDLDEAAILDGASHATIFWRVILPNAGAALATVGVFCFIYNWRDFMGPLIYLNSPDMQTLEVGLRTYQSLQSEQWHLLMAGSVLVMLPLFVIFLIGQKYFVKGIVMSGIK